MRRPVPDRPLLGQESVWDFPRPAIAQPVSARLRVVLSGTTIAETARGVRTIETSHPPTYYFPMEDLLETALRPVEGGTFCEWKGSAAYFDVAIAGTVRPRAAWTYPRPTAAFESIRGHVAFYPASMDACFVDGELVQPQPGRFYGGWVTSSLAGPFKGVPGSNWW